MIAHLLKGHCTQKKEINTNRNISEFLYCKTLLIKMTLYRNYERISGDVSITILMCTIREIFRNSSFTPKMFIKISPVESLKTLDI